MSDNTSDIKERADRLKTIIQMTKLSKKEFAQLVGKTPRLIYMWEAGTAPISSKSIPFIVSALEKIGIYCSPEWIFHGKGAAPQRDNSSLYDSTQDNIFEQFNLDFSLSSLSNMYKKIYPDLRFLLIEDFRFAPRIEPKCLLIAVPVSLERFKDNWPWGYLHCFEDFQTLPIDIQQVDNELIASPFEQKTYISKSFSLEKPKNIYPIINIRPVY